AVFLIAATFIGFAAVDAKKQRLIAEAQTTNAANQAKIAENQTRIAATQTRLKLEQERTSNIAIDRAELASYSASFIGILDQWRSNPNVQDFKKRLDGFSEPHREFTWYLCRSLVERDTLEPQSFDTKHGAVNAVSFLDDNDNLVSG